MMSTSADLFQQSEVVLDLSRLLSRMSHPTPTGVDRVEMAYARGLQRIIPDRLNFAAVYPVGGYRRLSRNTAFELLDEVEERWLHAGQQSRLSSWVRAAKTIGLPRRKCSTAFKPKSTIYVQASHNNLVKPALIRRILGQEQAKFVCMIHDLIPIQFPEYARPNGAALHVRRIRTAATLADGIMTNSHATLRSLKPYLEDARRSPATAVAHLGVPDWPTSAPRSVDRPYFVCVGTIEPRKNHLLLLHLWRSLAKRCGPDALPQLMIVGRRGWENEQVIDLLERCPILRGCVLEFNRLADRDVQALIAGARALLLPSFAEGYGMPVTEALAMGIPVVCSDLPALREAGGDLPCFLDPLDGCGWERAILDLAAEASSLRQKHLERLAGWNPPSWEQHIAILVDLLHRVAS